MSTYLAARCPQCTKWIPLRQCDADTPTYDPTLFMQLACPHCGQQSKLLASNLELVDEADLRPSAQAGNSGA